jgi:hypothetical protein
MGRKPRGGIEARIEAAGFRWRECYPPSVQGQRKVYKEPVSPSSTLKPLYLFLSLAQHGNPAILINTGNVTPIDILISQPTRLWKGKKSLQ